MAFFFVLFYMYNKKGFVAINCLFDQKNTFDEKLFYT